jgi:hypothetical protein
MKFIIINYRGTTEIPNKAHPKSANIHSSLF